jgi:hypothetical protein
MKRGLIAVFSVTAMLAAFAPAAQGQLNPGFHAAYATDVYGGTYGIGASLELDIPLFPIDVFLAGETFFPDCGTADGCSYRGASADLHFTMPLPVLQPYALAGLAYRRTDPGSDGAVRSDKGIGVGAGLNIGALVVGGYVEIRYEFVDPDDQWVARIGIRF